MSPYTQIIYQVIWSTKYRNPSLVKPHRPKLFAYIAGILHKKKCFVYEINGVEDHVHLLFRLHPSVALSDLVKDIKIASSIWIKASDLFPLFRGWQRGYSAFTYSQEALPNLRRYVLNQERHHEKRAYQEELLSRSSNMM